MIGYNIHLMDIMSNNLKLTLEAYTLTSCRAGFMINLGRILLYQMILVSTQYAVTLACVSLILIELLKIGITTIAYVRYRHLRSIIIYLLEMCQPIFLTVFLSTCLITVHRDVSYDQLSIIMILISSFTENILTAINIGMMVYFILKAYCNTKKSKNFMKKKPIDKFIVHMDRRGIQKMLRSIGARRVSNAMRLENQKGITGMDDGRFDEFEDNLFRDAERDRQKFQVHGAKKVDKLVKKGEGVIFNWQVRQKDTRNLPKKPLVISSNQNRSGIDSNTPVKRNSVLPKGTIDSAEQFRVYPVKTSQQATNSVASLVITSEVAGNAHLSSIMK